jgi:virulence factor Mce-like protein
MRRTTVAPVALLAVAALIAVLVATSGSSPYRVQLELSTATGLREGSQVKVGGVPVGKVHKLRLAKDDVVVADLALDDNDPVGPGASASVVTSNLLGSKFIQLDRGDVGRPLPSGTRLPASRVDYPVDLDQVLNVLDPDTRTRLQVLLNEAGTAVTGRQEDLSATLRLLPPSLKGGAKLLAELNTDNGSLERLVKNASGVVDRVTGERRQLTRVIDGADGVLRTTAQRQAALRETLARAPGTLRVARRVLADMEATTVPLRPAADAIRATAPALTDTLAQLPGFQKAAEPTLQRATDVAPTLTKLAAGATPVLRRARPTLTALQSVASTSKPLTDVLRVSIDDGLGLAEGWARAIQTRDKLGHVFRGRAILPVNTLASLVARLVSQQPASAAKKAAPSLRPQRDPDPQAASTPTAPPPAGSAPKLPKLPLPHVPTVVSDVNGVLDSLLGGLKSPKAGSPPPASETSGGSTAPARDLLDFLLGP